MNKHLNRFRLGSIFVAKALGLIVLSFVFLGLIVGPFVAAASYGVWWLTIYLAYMVIASYFIGMEHE